MQVTTKQKQPSFGSFRATGLSKKSRIVLANAIKGKGKELNLLTKGYNCYLSSPHPVTQRNQTILLRIVPKCELSKRALLPERPKFLHNSFAHFFTFLDNKINHLLEMDPLKIFISPKLPTVIKKAGTTAKLNYDSMIKVLNEGKKDLKEGNFFNLEYNTKFD